MKFLFALYYLASGASFGFVFVDSYVHLTPHATWINKAGTKVLHFGRFKLLISLNGIQSKVMFNVSNMDPMVERKQLMVDNLYGVTRER